MSRLQGSLNAKRAQGEKILSLYLTAGYPEPEATAPLLHALEAGGADLIELGAPFSDPQADGATIQAASHLSLSRGTTLASTLEAAAAFRKNSTVPLILMGYANPFMQYGWKKLLTEAGRMGIDGYIVPDLPLDESREYQAAMAAADQSLIYLVSPNTPEDRIREIDALSTAFIYAVSLTGVTGARQTLPGNTRDYLARVRDLAAHPVLVGFGVAGADAARMLAPFCDGIIVGSALLDLIGAAENIDAACRAATAFVRELKQALHEVS